MKPPDRQPPDNDTEDAPWEPNGQKGFPDEMDRVWGLHQPLDDSRTQELADDLLVHALLVGRFQDTPELASQRVNRVCLAFERLLSPARWYWKVGLSTAAAAIIVLGLALFFFSSQNVQAQLSQVLDAFDIGDRTFQIDIGEDPGQPSPDSPKGWTRAAHRPAFKSARARMLAKRLDGALLYVRNRKHVLTYTTPTGLKIARGFDGKQGWMTHPWRGLPVSSDPNLLQAAIPDEAVSLLFVDLRDMLHQIRKNYTLSKPCRSPSQDGGPSVLYFAADRVTPRTRLPRRIELWVDAETGQIHDILCTGVSFRRSVAQYVLRITLVNAAPLSSDWFTPQAHLSREQTL
jgi:hypothetical protein